MMQKIRWFLLILIIAFLLAVILLNSDPTDINLVIRKQSLPLSVLLIATLTLGFLFGALTTASMLRRDRRSKSPAKPAKTPPSATAEESPLNTAAD